MSDLLSFIADLSMHREGNAIPRLVTHTSEGGQMIDHRREVGGSALALRIAQNALAQQLRHMLLVGEDMFCLNGGVCR
eukprot:1986523-Pyramimonas_sp.AAC.1